MATFAEFRMVDVLPADVREWIAKLQFDGVQPPTIRYAMTVLSAIFTTALNDQITFLHPCMGVKTPTVATKRRRIITPDQFGALYDAIPTRELQLLVETDVETGLRWGELIELRKKDIDLDTGVITVSRVAGELAAKFNPDGQRFFVKHYPKDTEWRAVTLNEHMFDQLHDYARGLQPNDLLFSAPNPPNPDAADRGPCPTPTPSGTRTQRQGPALPPRHHQRLRRRRLPLPTLQRRLRRLPCPRSPGADRGPPSCV